jgi:hypothetical protein
VYTAAVVPVTAPVATVRLVPPIPKKKSPLNVGVSVAPRQFRRYVTSILANPKAAQARALQAQKEVFEKYTTFHRASEFVTMLTTHFNLP